MSPRNRRVPPKGNPDEAEAGQDPSSNGGGGRTQQIPWSTLVITTGITTVSGYLFLELIRAIHRKLKARREEKLEAKNPTPVDPPGRLQNGSFQLPLPEGGHPPQMSGPPHQGFAQPRLVDVNNPLGALQHQMQQHQVNTDERLRRIEHLLQQSNVGYTGTG